MEVLIITGGSIDIEYAENYVKNRHFDRIIAADSGLSHCRDIGLVPTDIIGDFDSLADQALLECCRGQGIPIHTHPVRKDYTDTHLAVLFAAEGKPDQITILGATGSRYDHAIANIGLLGYLADRKISCRIVDAGNQMEILAGPAKKEYRKDPELPFFSLIAWGGDASGISLTGFSYPLKDAVLTPYISLGISNEITEETAAVEVKNGHLLIIRSRD